MLRRYPGGEYVRACSYRVSGFDVHQLCFLVFLHLYWICVEHGGWRTYKADCMNMALCILVYLAP